MKVKMACKEKLQLPDIQLERAHCVGQRSDQRCPPIIARFARFVDREAVMRNVTKLRGSRIFINEDLCAASQSIRKAQLPLLKQARSEGKTAYLRHTKLIIKEKSRYGDGAATRDGPSASGLRMAGFGAVSGASISGGKVASDCGSAGFGAMAGASVGSETAVSSRGGASVGVVGEASAHGQVPVSVGGESITEGIDVPAVSTSST